MDDQALVDGLRELSEGNTQTPPTATRQITAAARRRRLGRGVLAGGAAGLTCAAVAFAAASIMSPPAPRAQTPATTSVSEIDPQLTGRAAGEALGLTPIATDQARAVCDGPFAEYVKGMGFCLEDVPIADRETIGWQILGQPRTAELEEYIAVRQQLQAENSKPAEERDAARVRELLTRMSELGPILHEQRQ